jgi:outer membrane protein assembly factor BamB
MFLTCIENGKLDCRAYDRATGKLLWTRPVAAEKIEGTHAFSNPAASTPAADAERVIFHFGSYGLLAFNHDGKALWDKKLPPQVSRGGYGTGTSPILCNDLVVLACDSDQGGSRLLAFKRATGEVAWETLRPLFTAGWSTPVLWTRRGLTEILLLGSKKLTAYDPAKGQELWSLPGFTLETACSPAFEDDQLFVCAAGIGGRSSQKFDSSGWKQLLPFDANHDGKIQFDEIPENFHLIIRAELPAGHPGRELPFNTREMVKGMDEDKDGALSEQEWNKAMEGFENMDVPVVMALRSSGVEKAEDRIVWKYGRGIPEIPSPLACRGKLYLVRDGGVLQCMDASSGTVMYQERLGAAGGYTASPVARRTASISPHRPALLRSLTAVAIPLRCWLKIPWMRRLRPLRPLSKKRFTFAPTNTCSRLPTNNRDEG